MASETQRIEDIVVIGAGPAGLMAADAALRAGARVRICEAMPTAGRKFLMAGRSGLNITHSEEFERFVARYGAAAPWLRPMLEAFSPADMRAFCAELGVETFVGSSGRVFPTAMKASPMLRSWLARLARLGATMSTRRRLAGIEADGALRLIGPDGATTIRPRATILALGGASWPKLGSNGQWTDDLAAHGVRIVPFRPSNCAVEIAWSAPFLARNEGAAIKTAAFAHGGRSVRGEAVVTRRGLEGGPIYALAAAIGDEIAAGRRAEITLDLKPDLALDALVARLQRRRSGDSLSNALRKTLGLSPAAAGLLREAFAAPATDAAELARRVKCCVLDVRAVAGLDRAISSAGGVALDELNEQMMLKKLPGLFVAGEMLDWDAPTGGYLLQASFATGAAAGKAAAGWRR